MKPVLVALSLAGYIFISFFIERYQTLPLLGTYGLLFAIYFYQLRNLSEYRTREITSLAIILRISVLIALPNLSDDFYRFIWDGRILSAGHNPFQYLPAEALTQDIASNITHDLYYRLNSPGYFTVYPPFVQFIFLTSASIFPDDIYGSVLVMKVFALLAEIILLMVFIRLLRRMELPTRYVAIYAFNPLIILEISGNLHHEGIMLLFLCISVYLLLKYKYFSSAVMWGLAIATKLLPLIYLPLLLHRMKLGTVVKFISIILFVSVILFLPLIEGLVEGMGASISLYFQKFEFNASIYYIVREVGYLIKGYNIIATAGPALGLLVFFLIFIYSYKTTGAENIFVSMSWIFTIFLVFSTTVHPWYIVSLIGFAVFTGYLFPVLWSLLIFMTYAGYGETGYVENLWIVVAEYTLTFVLMSYEMFKKDKKPLLYRIINLSPRFMPSSHMLQTEEL